MKNLMPCSLLFDNEDNQYVIEIASQDSDFFQAYIWWQRTLVGRVNWIIESSILHLADLVIFDDPVLPRNGLFSLRPFQRPKRNFRGRGLGSAMLKYVIAQAEQIGVIAISGFITSDDADHTLYLFDFYRKHGFEVTVPQNRSGQAATIYREVR